MRDAHGRPVTGLRISLTERCNLRCRYCHREGASGPAGPEMTADEVGRIAAMAASFGVRSVKLTGGEPLLRDDIAEVVAAVRRARRVREVSMTTNGVLLGGRAQELREAGLDRVNVSLPALDPALFRELSGVDALGRALEGVEDACAHLSPVKLNFVLTSCNAHELERVMGFARRVGAVLQVIELVDANLPCDAFGGSFVPAAPLEERLRREAEAVERRCLHARSRYRLPDGLEVEVVRSMHNSAFCANCSRLRLTADGRLKPCLMRGDNLVDLLGPLRSGDLAACRGAFRRAVEARAPFFR